MQSVIDNEFDESDDLSNSLKLTFGLTFSNWKDFKNWIYMFGLKEDFNYKIRTSETIQSVMWRATYECAKFGSHVLQTTSDPMKQYNAHPIKNWKSRICLENIIV